MKGCGGVDSELPLIFHVFIILFLWVTPLHGRFLASAEIITIDNFTVVFRSGTDAHFYVVGDAKEVGREGGTLEKKGKQGGAVRVKSKMDGVYARGTYTQHFRGVPWILSQNELILATVLDAFRDAIAMLLRYVPSSFPIFFFFLCTA